MRSTFIYVANKMSRCKYEPVVFPLPWLLHFISRVIITSHISPVYFARPAAAAAAAWVKWAVNNGKYTPGHWGRGH